MNLSESLRADFFWVLDFVKGNRVKRNLNETSSILANPNLPETRALIESNLDQLLKHASATVPFYKKFHGFNSLKDFPVINKNIIRDNQRDFLSVNFFAKKLHKVTTSGSTGAPLTVWQDKIKRYRHVAENIYFSEIAGYKLGTRLYYLRVWNEINRKSLINRLTQNIIPIDVSDLSERNLEKILSQIENDKSQKTVLAFSSTFEAIAQHLVKNSRRISAGVNSLITISESLPEGARKVLKLSFGCPVISRYSNMENGFIAQQCCDECGEYHINVAGFYVELLHPDKDEPVNDFEKGRIVVTDLFNYAMPLIRYDTGDIGIKSEKSVCGIPGPVFLSVEGRRVDFIYDTKGRLLSPHVITNTMWRYASVIRQFQFIQNGKNEYVIRLNCGGSDFKERESLLNSMKYFLGENASISIEIVNEIPSLVSGKRKKIVNNYNQF